MSEGSSSVSEDEELPEEHDCIVLMFSKERKHLTLRPGTSSAQFQRDLKDSDAVLGELLYVDCRDCRLTNFAFLDKCTKLLELNINGNGLTALPQEVCKLTTLQELSVSYQPISEIPEDIGRLTNLTYLAFYQCPIAWVPQSLKKLRLVEKFWLNSKIVFGTEPVAETIAAAARVCRLDGARQTCRCFMWVRKVAPPPYCRMPKEISKMICLMLLEIAKKDAMAETAKKLIE